jgi:hypothetical protein
VSTPAPPRGGPGRGGWGSGWDNQTINQLIVQAFPGSTQPLLVITDQFGNILFQVDTQGNVTSAGTLSVAQDIVLGGTSLSALLGGLINPDPWHQMTLLNGAVSGSLGNQFPSYRLSNTENIVYVSGTVKITNNTVFAQLPAGYFNPNTQVQFPAALVSSTGSIPAGQSPFLQCDVSGNLVITNSPGGGTVNLYAFNGMLYLDIPNSPTTGGGGGNKQTFTTTWTATDTFSYEGTNADSNPNPGFTPGALINHNGRAYQGDDQLGDNGNTSTFIVWPAAVATALSGATVNWVKITLTNAHSWFNSGMTYAIGYTTAGVGGGSRPAITNADLGEVTTAEGATHTYQISNLSAGYATALKNGNPFVLYHAASSRTFYGFIQGINSGAAPRIQVNYTK